MALANLQTCSAMPFSKKPLTPVKKEKAKSQQGKGKPGDKDKRKQALKGFCNVKNEYQGSVWVRDMRKGREAMLKHSNGDKSDGKVGDNGMGKNAVTAKLQQGTGKVGDTGMGKKELTARVKDEWGNYLIEVRIPNELETIPMISYEQQTIERFKANLRMRARDLRIQLPPNFELSACLRFGCMDQKLIACGDFSLETMDIMEKPIVPGTAMVYHVRGPPPPDLLIVVKVNKFDGFTLFIQEKDSIEAVKAKIRRRARDLQIQLLSSNFELMACPLSGCMDQKLIACRDFCLIFVKKQRAPLFNDKVIKKKPSVCTPRKRCELPTIAPVSK